MSNKFFDKFPIIEYSNNQVIDITRRVTLLDKVSTNPYVYYPYEITAEERADQLSDRYYQDSEMSWLIYLTNKIVDPYYEWYMHEKEFSDFIDKKYGSLENARKKIKYYRNDWTNSSIIDTSAFNALTPGQQKYWEPNVTSNFMPVKNFRRKELEWTTTTNKIVSYNVANSNYFQIGEICNINFNDYQKGQGFVVSATNNIVTLQHMSGFYYADQIGSSLDYRIKDETDPITQTENFIMSIDGLAILANSTGVDSDNDVVTVNNASNYYKINDLVYYEVSNGETAIGGLTDNTYYRISFFNSTSISFLNSNIGANIILIEDRTGDAEINHISKKQCNFNISF